CQQRNLYPLTV
nr:immunoglobulin light chain junction region [Macaca mulatta]